MKEGPGTISDLALDPFAFQHHHRLRGFGVPVGGNHRARSKAAEQKAGAGGGIMGKSGKFNPRVGSRLPKRGIGKTNGGKHGITMPEGFLSDNRLGG